MVGLCLALGVWQVERLHWKEGLIAQRAAAFAAPPVAVPRTLADARPLDLHRVVADGVFLNNKEVLVHAIAPSSLAAGGLGFDVLTPLRLADGRIVFVNRGFVPAALKDPAARQAGEPAGQVHVAGRLRLPHSAKPGWFLPDNRPITAAGRGEWYWIDLPMLAATDGLPGAAPFYIEADAAPNPGGWPLGSAALPELPNHHLQYAITWFSLALAGAVIFVLSQRRDRSDDNSRPHS